MKYELTCINCPMGCRVTAEYDGKTVTNITGNTCLRGKKYAETEITGPVRTVTGLMRAAGRQAPVSVKTAAPVPKTLVFQVLDEMKNTPVTLPVSIGDVLIKNVCGTGVDVVAACSCD